MKPLSLAAIALFSLALPALAAGCKSAAERDSERLLPAVEAFAKEVPGGDPAEFVRTSMNYMDTLNRLEQKLGAELHPPPGSPAAAKLAPLAAWVASARAAHAALEADFAKEVSRLEVDAQADLAGAVSGVQTKEASDMAAALARTTTRVFVLWHGSGGTRGFDQDQQRLPPDRRAVDPSSRFIVGYVQRVGGEGVHFSVENVTTERKIAYITLYELPARRRLGVFTVKGETAPLPSPPPLPGTVIPGLPPPLVEGLLRPALQ